MLKLIEIFCAKLLSPSVRRAWIEIQRARPYGGKCRSPSVRRAWIEILKAIASEMKVVVTLREEGVD